MRSAWPPAGRTVTVPLTIGSAGRDDATRGHLHGRRLAGLRGRGVAGSTVDEARARGERERRAAGVETSRTVSTLQLVPALAVPRPERERGRGRGDLAGDARARVDRARRPPRSRAAPNGRAEPVRRLASSARAEARAAPARAGRRRRRPRRRRRSCRSPTRRRAHRRRPSPGSEVSTATPGAASCGAEQAAEGEPARREGRDPALRRRSDGRRPADRRDDRVPAAHGLRASRCAKLAVDADDRHGEAGERARRAAGGRRRARPRRRRRRRRSPWPPGSCRPGRAPPCPRATPGSPGTASGSATGASGAAVPSSGSDAVGEHGEPLPEDDADGRRRRRASRSRRPTSAPGAPAGPAIEPKSGPATPSFPAGATTSVSSVERAVDGLRLGAVGERGERLGHADERDPQRRRACRRRRSGRRRGRARRSAGRCARRRRRARSAVGCQPATRIGSTEAPGRDAADAARAARADEDAGELGPVPLDLPALLRVALRARRRSCRRRCRCRARRVRARYGCVRSTPVSSSAIVMPGAVEPGQPPAGDGAPPTAARRRERGRVGDAHRVDAGDLGVVLEQRDRARVERGREAVEHAGEAVVGPDAEAVAGELREHLLLRGEGLGRPAPLGRLGREPAPSRRAARPRASRGRRCSGRSGRPRAAPADEPAPRHGRRRGRGVGVGCVPSGGR